MNFNTIIVFDWETGSADPTTCVPLSLAAQAYNPRNLRPIEGATFDQLMRPKDSEWALVEDEALAVNKLTRAELEVAPDREVVWAAFVDFVQRHNPKKTAWTAPVSAGHNIRNFDLIIVERMCREYGTKTLFHKRDHLDLLNVAFLFFEAQKAPASYSMDALRDHFGLSKEGAHSALVDVRQMGDLLMKFLRLVREMVKRCPDLKGVQAA